MLVSPTHAVHFLEVNAFNLCQAERLLSLGESHIGAIEPRRLFIESEVCPKSFLSPGITLPNRLP